MSAAPASLRDSLAWARRPELALVALMAMIVAMLVIPLPTPLVDFFIGLNIVLAILIFLSSFYIERILHFSTFPSVLLFTTLFRLALSISTSRLILLDADAGHIIQAFGDYVIGDNLAVGLVIFLIVTIVQFIVITKGSERVGEVAARFSLDGMPGKQMSIDADLKTGTINAAGAQARRREVERESQLYGSFDGAMKFVKGDAIAGIVILLVNLVGGIAVGMSQQGMSFDQAMHTFTLLTIGDGLVAQIPALLICVSAGFIVTRVGGDSKNLGDGIVGELFGSDPVLLISSVLVLLVGVLPGFPFHVFALLAAALGALWYARQRRGRQAVETDDIEDGDPAGADALAGPGKRGGVDRMLTETMPLICLVDDATGRAWDAGRWSDRLREEFFLRYGMRLPQLAVRRAAASGENTLVVLVNEVVAARGIVVPGHVLLLGAGDDMEPIEPMLLRVEPNGQAPQLWAPVDSKDKLGLLGMSWQDDFNVMFRVVARALLRNVNELFGVQETRNMLDDLEKKYPELVKEAYRHMPMQRLADVFQRLLREEISIRNLKIVLECLAQWAGREKDTIMLVEHVRISLSRFISDQFAYQGSIRAVMLSPALEEIFRNGVRQSQGEAFLSLEPSRAQEVIQRITLVVESVQERMGSALIVTSPDIRRFVKRFVELRLPDVAVLSFGEISETITIDIVESI
ncbi:EscV/YscV/HrcV family type III secretion system export apparatus protein [Pinirhizobacter sp.]|jgi:type III secretion protein V|uniref:EscV/YscV/HrcV family type III secretion system export apparatus protein n=1 Tax=Pinirhizobacter sp. TaxID=2950432 RepID=UPI002F4114F0